MIEIRNLVHRYGKHTALSVDRLDLDACTVLVGPNGAGKSTLLLVLAGLLVPTEGSVTVAGAAVGSVDARRAISFVPDAPALFDDLTLQDQMLYVARLHGGNSAKPAPVATELIEPLGAEDLLGRLPGAMSKGQRQKASLLVAIARPCSILLTDEPTTGLDTESREALLRGFQLLETGGVTIVSSTHDGELIEATARHVHLMSGRIVTGDEDETGEGQAEVPATRPRWRQKDA